MKTRIFITIILITAFSSTPLFSQNQLDQTRLFQSYFFDSPISAHPYGEGAISLENYEYANIIGVSASGGYPVNEKIEIELDWGFSNISPEEGDGESGIRDIRVYGRYSIKNDRQKSLSAGGYISLPVGSEDIGAGKLNVGGFAAGRYYLENGMAITGNFGLVSIEVTEYTGGDYDAGTGTVTPLEEETSHEISVRLGGGFIYPVNEFTGIVGELAIQSKYDFMMLSGGIDYKAGKGRIRAMLGLGLDDGSPDFMVRGGYEIFLSDL